MAAVAAGLIDPNIQAKYPVILSDALLGKDTKEVYTSIRYNHKPASSSGSSAGPLHLQPSTNSDSTYDLSYLDNSEKYSYNGVRTSGNDQYVLIFDTAKKAFVLHRIDSTFDMNLTSTPRDDDTTSLRSSYPQLEPTAQQAEALQRRPSKSSKKDTVTNGQNDVKRRKIEKSKKPAREPSPEVEADDSDDGLTIEYPDGPSLQQYQYQSTPIFRREESEEVSEEDSDAEHEEDDNERNQDVDVLELPGPANDNPGGLDDEDMDLDLEAELEQALKETGAEMGPRADESSESEEE
jgi:hypothetical protein